MSPYANDAVLPSLPGQPEMKKSASASLKYIIITAGYNYSISRLLIVDINSEIQYVMYPLQLLVRLEITALFKSHHKTLLEILRPCISLEA